MIKLPNTLMGQELRVVVVGAGGTGSILLGALAQMAISLHALGHPGLHVTVIDDDTVSPANIGRQAFSYADVGKFKAEVLVNRINLSFGLNWSAMTERLKPDVNSTDFGYGYRRFGHGTDIWIGCVDTRSARKAIQQHWLKSSGQRDSASIWLDCGNTAHSGQVILGLRETRCIKEGKNDAKGIWRPPVLETKTLLPSCADLFPEMVDETLDGEDTAPSCSLPEALAKQDLFTNRAMADAAMNLLWQFLRHAELQVHGAFINLKNCRTNPIPVDEKVWKRMGFDPAAQAEPVEDGHEDEEKEEALA